MRSHKPAPDDHPYVVRMSYNHPAFSIDNNYHYNLSQSRRQDQKRIEIRIIIIQDVPCETIEEHIFIKY